MPQDLDTNQLNALIQAANAGWTAGETSVSELPPEERMRRLGYKPGPGEESLEQRVQASTVKAAALKATIAADSVSTSGAPTAEPPDATGPPRAVAP